MSSNEREARWNEKRLKTCCPLLFPSLCSLAFVSSSLCHRFSSVCLVLHACAPRASLASLARALTRPNPFEASARRPGAILRRLGAILGRLGACLARLGVYLARRGAIWRPLGVILGRLGAYLFRVGAVLASLGRILASQKLPKIIPRGFQEAF